MNELISVIVPVYNAEQYLESCIENLLCQTYLHMEIIFVNDGSIDHSLEIIKRFQQKDDRIIVATQKNGGASSARNRGIQISSGKYIMFVDADDCITNDYVEYLYHLVKKYRTRIAVCDSFLVKEKKKIKKNKIEKEVVLSQKEVLKEMLYKEIYFIAPWGKIFEKSLWEDISFPEGKTYEDLATLYKLYMKCDKICCSTYQKYYYCIRENSLTTKTFTEKYFDRIYHADEMAFAITKKYPDLKTPGLARQTHDRLATLVRLISVNEEFKEQEKEIKNFLKEHKKEILKNPYISKKDKAVLLAFSLGNSFVKFFWKLYKK